MKPRKVVDRRIFTDEVIETMRVMKRRGATSKEIARAINSSPRSVEARCSQLSIKRTASGYLSAPVSTIIFDSFVAEARRRGTTPTKLAHQIFKIIVTDNLFAAVLD